MELSLTLRKSHLWVFSAICSNFAVVWIGAIFITQDILGLTVDILLAIVSVILAVAAEELLAYYD